MSLLPKSIHRCRRYPTKFNSGRDIPTSCDGSRSVSRSAKLAESDGTADALFQQDDAFLFENRDHGFGDFSESEELVKQRRDHAASSLVLLFLGTCPTGPVHMTCSRKLAGE